MAGLKVPAVGLVIPGPLQVPPGMSTVKVTGEPVVHNVATGSIFGKVGGV